MRSPSGPSAPASPSGVPPAGDVLDPSGPSRFRATYPRLLGVGLALSVGVHAGLAVVLAGSRIHLPTPGGVLSAPRVVMLPPAHPDAPPAVQIAPPVAAILRPSAPVRTSVPGAPELEAPEPVYIPYDVAPRLVNVDHVLSALRDGYPSGLPAEAGESVVILWLFVDDSGRVTHVRMRESTGYPELDRLAQEIAPMMAYRPALHMDKTVGVWVAQQIRFRPAS